MRSLKIGIVLPIISIIGKYVMGESEEKVVSAPAAAPVDKGVHLVALNLLSMSGKSVSYVKNAQESPKTEEESNPAEKNVLNNDVRKKVKKVKDQAEDKKSSAVGKKSEDKNKDEKEGEEGAYGVEFTLSFYSVETPKTTKDQCMTEFLSANKSFHNAKFDLVFSDKKGEGVTNLANNTIPLAVDPDSAIYMTNPHDKMTSIEVNLFISKEKIEKEIIGNKSGDIGDKYSIRVRNVSIPVEVTNPDGTIARNINTIDLYTEMKSIDEIEQKLNSNSSENFLSRNWIAILIACLVIVSICVVVGFILNRNK